MFDFEDYIPGSTTDSGERRINCPYCHTRGNTRDQGHHMYVNIHKGIYHCFRCEAKGRVPKELGLTYEYNKSLGELFERVKNLFTMKPKNVIDLDEVSDPLTEEGTPMSYRYMTQVRRFTPEDIERYHLRVGKEFQDTRLNKEDKVLEEFTNYSWNGRIIFPYIDAQGDCIYMVGRSINREPKYLNTKGSKGNVIYNLESVTDGTCILCEGIISAWAAQKATGVPAICTLGKSIYDDQLEKIKSKVDTVFVSYDGDVTERELDRTIYQLLKDQFKVRKVILPKGEDPDSLGFKKYKECFDRAVKVSVF